MGKFSDKFKTYPKPIQFAIGVGIVAITIVIAKLGFDFGSWLKCVQ